MSIDQEPAPGAVFSATIDPAFGLIAQRSPFTTGRLAVSALFLRDLHVLRKSLGSFAYRTLVQPFFLVFVFLYVFPSIGQGVGGHSKAAESAFATVLVPGVVGIATMFQGVTTVAVQLSQEFGYTREIEDRVQAPCPVELVALAKICSGAVQAILGAAIVFPMAAFVHASGVHAHLSVSWPALLTLLPLIAVLMSSLGLFLGTTFEPRNIGLIWGFVVLPITFLGGIYYRWSSLSTLKIGGFSWLQTIVLANPLIYVTEGLRGALTDARHMHLYVVYPALAGFTCVFLVLGVRGFRRRVLS
jgi:ABC-2 type transport system permease protein